MLTNPGGLTISKRIENLAMANGWFGEEKDMGFMVASYMTERLTERRLGGTRTRLGVSVCTWEEVEIPKTLVELGF